MSHVASPDDQHRAVELLLPWYVTGQLDETDRRLVMAHLADCAPCREELAAERGLAHAVATVPDSAVPGWEALKAQLPGADAITPAATAGQAAQPRYLASRPPRPGRWRKALPAVGRPDRLRWVVAAQFVALLVLGGLLLPSGRPGPYRTLGATTAAPSGNVIAMFRPGLREADLRRMLDLSDARIVGGPTDAGAWVLDVPGGPGGRPLARLRAQADVTMAEPIGDASAR